MQEIIDAIQKERNEAIQKFCEELAEQEKKVAAQFLYVNFALFVEGCLYYHPQSLNVTCFYIFVMFVYFKYGCIFAV